MPKDGQEPGPFDFPTFGELLRYLRERAHLSQRELAALVGYHYSYISYLEKNTRIVDEANLLGRFVPALNLEHRPEWTRQLLKLAKKKKGAQFRSDEVGAEPDAGEGKVFLLPTSLTPMIGRDYESARLRKLILDPDIRLITVTGPPGVVSHLCKRLCLRRPFPGSEFRDALPSARSCA